MRSQLTNVVQVRSYSYETSLLGQVGRLAAQVERQLETELKVRFSLTFSQFRILSALAGTGETSQRALAEVLGLSPALVTRQIEALSKRSLVAQKQNPSSRRENVISLTKRGERAAEELAVAVRTIEQGLVSELGLEEETAFARALTQLLGA